MSLKTKTKTNRFEDGLISKDNKLSLSAHLEELRSRLIKSVIFVIAGAFLTYAFVNTLMPLIIRPVGKVVFIAPQEAFIANMKVAFFGGLFLSSPFVLYQIWQFVTGALNEKERKYIILFGPLSFLFFLTGISFCYFFIIPISINFLLGFATDFLTPSISISKYISFIGSLTLVFGLVFELPLVSLFLTKIGIVTPMFLSRKRKHAIVFIFIAAAVMTPPDAITQCLMAVPLILLYEIGIIFSKCAYKPI